MSNTMKTVLAILAGLAICGFIFGNIEPKSVEAKVGNDDVKSNVISSNAKELEKKVDDLSDFKKAQQRVVDHFKTEKLARDSVWANNQLFKVGVLDDGTERDGYAQYVCQVLVDYGFGGKEIRVEIIDIAKLVRTEKWVVLGSARCN